MAMLVKRAAEESKRLLNECVGDIDDLERLFARLKERGEVGADAQIQKCRELCDRMSDINDWLHAIISDA
jgi:hypothetical protein